MQLYLFIYTIHCQGQGAPITIGVPPVNCLAWRLHEEIVMVNVNKLVGYHSYHTWQSCRTFIVKMLLIVMSEKVNYRMSV